MNSNQQNSIFKWEDLSINQADGVFKVGTDAILLGSWIPTLLIDASTILDVGTGTGILALKMSDVYSMAIIEGIDHDENAVRLARHNFSLSDAAERLSTRLENIFETEDHVAKKYDLIICNPPYFFEQYGNQRNFLINAKHAVHPVALWMRVLCSRLSAGGHICLVLPFEISFDWIRSANVMGLYVQDRLDIISFAVDIYPKRTLLHLSDQLIKPGLKKLIMYTSGKKHTTEYLALSGLKPGSHDVGAPVD